MLITRNVFSYGLALAGLVLLSEGKLVHAETINVPADYTTIQDAINASSTGDTIKIAEGSYFEHAIDTGDRAITIQG